MTTTLETPATTIPKATETRSLKRTSRFAGVLYLAIFVIAPFAFLLGRSTIVVPGDPAATTANVVAHEAVFRWGMAAETAVFLIEVVLAGLLYGLLRPVSRSISLAAAFGRLGEAAVQAVNLLTGAITLIVATGGSMAAFAPDQLDALVALSVDANEFMVQVWGLFFALHLLLLGWLVYRSGFFPRILGALLMLASFGYFADSYATLVAPGLGDLMQSVVLVLAVPGELAFALWLLVKGPDHDAWNRRVLEARAL
jgi:hypothetical protein